jgi:hypothetical protein
MFVEKDITFTKEDAKKLFNNHNGVAEETVCNSKIITKTIQKHLGDFPLLEIEEWELADESNIIRDKYVLKVLLFIVFSQN